jgi:hypothetical protein
MGGGQREPCVTYAIQGNMIGRADTAGPQGNGFSEEVGYTLTTGDVHGVATIAPPHVFKIRGGCEGGGKGYLGQDEQAFTITTGSDQQVAVPIAFTTEQTPKFNFNQSLTLTQSEHKHNQCVATFKDQPQCWRVYSTDGVAPTLQSGEGRGNAILQSYAVRRLTPIECERLQGFPDNYTNIPWRKKPEAPDGLRYKALGNSWAVPVVRWIGERINNQQGNTNE